MEVCRSCKSACESSLQPKNFGPDFVLTGRRGGNKIQLQSFGGCDSVETDSPIEHHPGRTGERMLTLRGEHFYLAATSADTLILCIRPGLSGPPLQLRGGSAPSRCGTFAPS